MLSQASLSSLTDGVCGCTANLIEKVMYRQEVTDMAIIEPEDLEKLNNSIKWYREHRKAIMSDIINDGRGKIGWTGKLPDEIVTAIKSTVTWKIGRMGL